MSGHNYWEQDFEDLDLEDQQYILAEVARLSMEEQSRAALTAPRPALRKRKCPTCRGRGNIRTRGGTKDCLVCMGQGWLQSDH
jgi:hypothetical protein